MKKRHVWPAFVCLFVLTGTASAVQAAAGGSAAPAADGIPPIRLGGGVLSGILSGILGAVLAVGVGILKSKDTNTGAQEPPDMSKAWETLLIGAVIGLAAGIWKKAPADIVSFLTTSPLGGAVVAFAEMAWNALFRQTAPLIRKTIGYFRTGAAKNPAA